MFILLYQYLQCSWNSNMCFKESIRLRTFIIIGLNLLIINQLIFAPEINNFTFSGRKNIAEVDPFYLHVSVILPKVCQQNRLLSQWRHVYILQRLSLLSLSFFIRLYWYFRANCLRIRVENYRLIKVYFNILTLLTTAYSVTI